MITVSEAIEKMISDGCGSRHDTDHFIKVWAFARTIGKLEGIGEKEQQTLEFAAVVHDIACPVLRKEYGSAPGDLQEKYGPPLVMEFFRDTGMDGETLSRICWLVGHHHTVSDVDGMDHQILLEADFLVNAGEQEKYREAVEEYREKVFKTKTGLCLLEKIFTADK